MSIIIQAGHVNIENNCDHGLREETGAPGEREYVAQIAAEVCGALNAHGLIAVGADANANCDPQMYARDQEAVIALHCDGRSRSGFAVGVGNPTEDGAAEASAKLMGCLRSAYSTATGLADLSAEFESDPNISQYYLFNAMTPATPFALIELGAIADADGNEGPDKAYLEAHIHDVADGIVAGVLTFLDKPATPVPAESGAAGSEQTGSVQPAHGSAPAEGSSLPLADILTNLGQAIQYGNELLAETDPKAPPLVTLEESLTNCHTALLAMLEELHTARHLLGGE